MSTLLPAPAGIWRLARLLCVAAAAALSGCASVYVDGQLKDVAATAYKKPASPRPVQMIFEFQTKGAVNSRVTDAFKAQANEVVTNTGLFAKVSETPVESGNVLSVVVNNVPLTDDAFTKGFAAGMTFGLAGTSVTDGYVCTISYLDGSRAPIKLSARHAIHTVLGTGSAPADAVKAESIEAAARTMLRQLLEDALHTLSQNSAFQ